MINRCLACGNRKMDYRSILVSAYVVSAWLFAAAMVLLVLQNRITI